MIVAVTSAYSTQEMLSPEAGQLHFHTFSTHSLDKMPQDFSILSKQMLSGRWLLSSEWCIMMAW